MPPINIGGFIILKTARINLFIAPNKAALFRTLYMKAKGGDNMAMITDYIDRIYKFALSQTFSEDEAEELSQEILLAALSSMKNLRDERKFEPWLWRLAKNVAAGFRRKMGKQRAMFVYDVPESAVEDDTFSVEDEELYFCAARKNRDAVKNLSGDHHQLLLRRTFGQTNCRAHEYIDGDRHMAAVGGSAEIEKGVYGYEYNSAKTR